MIFPIPTLPATDVGKRVDQFDPPHVPGVLVAELPLEAETERRAVWYTPGLSAPGSGLAEKGIDRQIRPQSVSRKPFRIK